MLDKVCAIAGGPLILIGITLFLFVVFARHRSRYTGRCCSPRGSWQGLILPWRVFQVRVCGYSLRGMRADAQGLVTCPECGRTSDPTRPRVARAWRPVRLGLVCLLLGVALVVTRSVRDGTWPQRLPTLAVVAGKRVLGDALPLPLVHETWQRAVDGEITGFSAKWLAAGLLEDLRDDDERFNMQGALHVLQHLPLEAVPVIERALDSEDWQQRQAAAEALRQIVDPSVASDRLIEVTVEGLADDALPRGNGSYSYVFNAARGTPYLVKAGQRVSPWLRPGLESGDRQQRLLCAIIAGFAGCEDLTELAAPVLVEHLGDNSIPEDAKVCAPALYRLGPSVEPYLIPHVDADDAQLRGLARAILDALEIEYEFTRHPGDKAPRITTIVHDPIRKMTLDRMEWWWLHHIGK